MILLSADCKDGILNLSLPLADVKVASPALPRSPKSQCSFSWKQLRWKSHEGRDCHFSGSNSPAQPWCLAPTEQQ